MKLTEQQHLYQQASSRVSRIYQSVVELRDDCGLTRQEFRAMVQRRPEFYAPIKFLADTESFWING